MPTNIVVRFYLALDRRQFAAAYGCLGPAERARLPFASWVAGYAHTLRSRLMLADDEVQNGDPVDHIRVQLYALDLIGGKRVAAVYAGAWHVDSHGHPSSAALRRQRVRGVPTFDPHRILTQDQRWIFNHYRTDVTGDGVPDNVYVTSGAGCGSCHAQQIWVYSSGRLVFQQEVDDARVFVGPHHTGFTVATDTPGSEGYDSCCPSKQTFETWTWSPDGFVLKKQEVKKLPPRI